MIEFLKERKIIIIIVVFIIILLIRYIINNNYNLIEENTQISNIQNNDEITKKEDDDEMIVVHITGEIKTPGIVKLKAGSRIQDAIDISGGITEDADIKNVNLAYKLSDGIKIRIPSIYDKENEEDTYITESSGDNIVISENSTKKSNKLININSATKSELQELKGIGASIANNIIEYREKNGKFKSIEEIKNVTGIGESKYENIKNDIEV